MKNVLIIAYSFPPIGGPGVQRTQKFVKYLSEFNCNPIVLTSDPRFIYYVKDPSLAKEIPQGLKVHRTFAPDLNLLFKILYGLKLRKLVNLIRRDLLFPDQFILWLPFVKRSIKKIIKKENIDIIYITSPPHSLQLLVHWIKKKYQQKIITDFRDPITFNYLGITKRYFQRCFKYEKGVLDATDFIIAHSTINKENYTNKFNIDESKIRVITNGYDQNDFNGVKAIKKASSKLIVSHVGRLYNVYNAVPFLEALGLIRNQLEDVEIRFIGAITTADKAEIKKHKLSGIVKVMDYCPHKKAIEYMLESDFLLLILADPNWEYWNPGKIFEYINTGNKIFAVVPENGSCAEIIRRTKTGVIVSPENTSEIADAFLKLIKERGKSSFDPDKAAIKEFERKNLTRKLAKVIEKLC